jgi:hypothetical protein
VISGVKSSAVRHRVAEREGRQKSGNGGEQTDRRRHYAIGRPASELTLAQIDRQ